MDPSIESYHTGTSRLIVWEPSPGTLYTIDNLAQMVCLSRRLIALYSRHGLIRPAFEPQDGGWYFTAETIQTLRRIENLRIVHRLDLSGMRLVLGLIKEIERLREEMDAPFEL